MFFFTTNFPLLLFPSFLFGLCLHMLFSIMIEQLSIRRLRKELFKFCPGEESQIMLMDKKDLEELITVVNPSFTVEENNILQRNGIIAEIAKHFPNMKKQLKGLKYQDLRQIYESCLLKEKENEKQEVIPIIQISIAQMKKISLQRLPMYQNEIKELTDGEIRQLYYQLKRKGKLSVEEDDGYNRNFNTQSKQQQNPNQNQSAAPKFNEEAQQRSKILEKQRQNERDKEKEKDRQRQNGYKKTSEIEDQNLSRQKAKFASREKEESSKKNFHQVLSKEATKNGKKLKKCRCKITLYLNESDLEDENLKEVKENQNSQQQKRRNKLASIVDSLHNALQKKKWVEQPGKTKGKGAEYNKDILLENQFKNVEKERRREAFQNDPLSSNRN